MHHMIKFSRLFLVLAVFSVLVMASQNANAATVSIVNQSSSELHAIYISGSGAGDWEENIIDGYVLPAGNEVDINIPNYSKFDLRIEDGDGNYEEYYEFPGKVSKIYLQGGGESSFE